MPMCANVILDSKEISVKSIVAVMATVFVRHKYRPKVLLASVIKATLGHRLLGDVKYRVEGLREMQIC
jgi:hypothetical protein